MTQTWLTDGLIHGAWRTEVAAVTLDTGQRGVRLRTEVARRTEVTVRHITRSFFWTGNKESG